MISSAKWTDGPVFSTLSLEDDPADIKAQVVRDGTALAYTAFVFLSTKKVRVGSVYFVNDEAWALAHAKMLVEHALEVCT